MLSMEIACGNVLSPPVAPLAYLPLPGTGSQRIFDSIEQGEMINYVAFMDFCTHYTSTESFVIR